MTKLILAIAADKHLTTEKLTKMVGSGERTIQRYLQELQDAGVLKRNGSDTNGEWILLLK